MGMMCAGSESRLSRFSVCQCMNVYALYSMYIRIYKVQCMSMYVCMYIRVYVYVSVCTYIYTCMHTYTHTQIQDTYTYMHGLCYGRLLRIYISIHADMCVCVRVCVCVCVCILKRSLCSECIPYKYQGTDFWEFFFSKKKQDLILGPPGSVIEIGFIPATAASHWSLGTWGR